jgi:hypothetical protein
MDAGNGDVGYATITGTVAGLNLNLSATVDLTTAIGVPAFLPPPTPAGATGFTTGTIDSRPTDALWQNGVLWFVSTYPCTPPGDTERDCVRATALDTSTATPTVQQDFVVGNSGYDFFMGGIGLAGDGTLHLVFSVASTDSNISTYAAAQLPGDAVNTLGPLTLVIAGSATYVGARWGDYVGVAQDPVDPLAVWQADEYPDATGAWATWVSQLTTAGATYHALAPVRVLDTRLGLGTTTFSSGIPRTFAVAGTASGVPLSATAVTGNLTVTGQTRAGRVALTPAPDAHPATSTLNFPLADTRANGVTVPLGAGGTLSATYTSSTGYTTQLVFDVTGYFAP